MEELGLEPSPRLPELERRILNQVPDSKARRARPGHPASGRARDGGGAETLSEPSRPVNESLLVRLSDARPRCALPSGHRSGCPFAERCRRGKPLEHRPDRGVQ